MARALDEVGDRFVGNPDGDWTDATPATFLGLYAFLHKHVYKVSPDDLADDWFPAFSMAKRCFEKDFNGNAIEMVEFLKWSWARTRVIRKRNPDSDFRVTWRYQFSRRLITDYKVSRSRK